MNCFSCRAELDDFLDGALSASQREKVAAHLSTCAECRAHLAQLQSDRQLARVALAELVAVPAPLELRLRVRAALQDERAAQFARPAWWQKLRLPSQSGSAVWSGTLVFATLALIILARPFAQQPPLPASVSTGSAPSEPSPNEPAAALAPPLAAQKAASATGRTAEKSGQTAPKMPLREAKPAETKPAQAKPVAKASAERDASRAKPPMRAREIAPLLPPLTSPLPPPIQNSVPAAPSPRSASNLAASMLKRRASDASDSARPDSARPDSAPPMPDPNPARQNAAKSAPPLQNRGVRAVTRSAAPATNSGAVSGLMKQSQAATGSLRDENSLFAVKISPADANNALSNGSNGNRITALENRSPAGASVAPASPAARTAPPMPSPQISRVAPPAPDSSAFAPQLPPGGGGEARARAGGFGGGRGGAANRGAAVAAPQSNSPVLAAPKSTVETEETRQWTLEITAPREVSGAQIRVILPPMLHFAAGDEDASRVVWSGDLVAHRAVKIGFALSGGRGGEKITVVVEQNGAAGQSKKLETLDLGLPTPK